jgi:hypothetical protein
MTDRNVWTARLLLTPLALSIATIVAVTDAPASASDDLFAGMTIRLVQTGSTGGSTDRIARLLVPYLEERLPGNPTVVVVDGGRGLAGGNEYEIRGARDGSEVLVDSSSVIMSQVYGRPEVQYDVRGWTPLMAQAAGGIAYVHPDIGYREPADLPDVQDQLILAGVFPQSVSGLFVWAMHLMGVDMLTIWGYEDTDQAHVAWLQGEATVDRQGSAFYLDVVQPLVDAGEAVPLFSQGHLQDGEFIRDPVFPDIPHVGEVYEAIHGEPPSGPDWEALKGLTAQFNFFKIFYYHNDVPDEMIAAWRQAAIEIANDPEFLEVARPEIGDYPWVVGDDLDTTQEALLGAGGEGVERWLDFLEKEEGVDIQR